MTRSTVEPLLTRCTYCGLEMTHAAAVEHVPKCSAACVEDRARVAMVEGAMAATIDWLTAPAAEHTAEDFAVMLLHGTRKEGLHWASVADLFRLAMQQAARTGRAA